MARTSISIRRDMKLASYIVDDKPTYGVVTGDGIVTLNQRLMYGTLRDALTAEALDDIRRVTKDAQPDHKLADVRFLPAIPNPNKIVCAGINYRSHAAETGRDIPT